MSKSKRQMIWVAVDGKGNPIHGVWAVSKKLLDLNISDRVYNKEAFEGEHAIKLPLAVYNKMRLKHKWPILRLSGLKIEFSR